MLCPCVRLAQAELQLLRNDSITQLIVKKSLHWFVAAETEPAPTPTPNQKRNPQNHPESQPPCVFAIACLGHKNAPLSWLLLPSSVDSAVYPTWPQVCTRSSWSIYGHIVWPFSATASASISSFFFCIFLVTLPIFLYTSFKGYGD